MSRIPALLMRSITIALPLALLVACGEPSDVVSPARTASSLQTRSLDAAGEPILETPVETLNAALTCTPFEHPDKAPVLLVHGTLTMGHEQYQATYLPLLRDRGFDVCTVTYPDRGLGDMQVSAEYIVHALRRMHADSGRKVAMIGHSQGALMPRWALKWWPSVRSMVSDFVMQAGPHQGTSVAAANPMKLLAAAGLPVTQGAPGGLGSPESLFQFASDSEFIRVLNMGDTTPGDIDYTNLYTTFDELVQPVTPVPTAALEFGQNNPKVANILLQDVCPGRVVDHVTIGLTDRLSFELALDAISKPGPANVARAGGSALCGAATFFPDQIFANSAAGEVPDMFRKSASKGLPNFRLTASEPPIKPYALRASADKTDAAASGSARR